MRAHVEEIRITVGANPAFGGCCCGTECIPMENTPCVEVDGGAHVVDPPRRAAV